MSTDTGRGAALVTGAARRIGRAIALDLADQGFDVAVHCHRSGDAARALQAEIEVLGRRAVCLEADLADEAAAAGLVGRAAEKLGPVVVLINNAAVFRFDRPDTVTIAGWSQHMAINLRAPFLLIQSLLSSLPTNIEGCVVNLIDQRVWNPTPNYTSYTISKFALLGLTRHLALALAPRVRVNAVGPGLVVPDPGRSDEAFQKLAAAAPLGRGTRQEEIAAAVRFLIESPSITGQMLALDAGFHMGWLHPGQQARPARAEKPALPRAGCQPVPAGNRR